MSAFAEWFLPDWDNEMKKTQRMLAAAPEQDLDWRPHAKSTAIGPLTSHVADVAIWPKFALDRDLLTHDAPDYKPMKLEPGGRDKLIAQFEAAAAESRAAIAAATEEHLQKHWKLSWNGHIVLDLPRVTVLRDVVLHHMIHHRGQLSVYLRLRDIPVPGMYGPSADEM